MRTLFDSDEDETEGKASEITLSTASLLGIFFGLVLVCGVFFGFGYSMGRGTGSGARSSASASSPPSNSGEADDAMAGGTPQAVKTPPAPAGPQEDTEASPKAAPSAP